MDGDERALLHLLAAGLVHLSPTAPLPSHVVDADVAHRGHGVVDVAGCTRALARAERSHLGALAALGARSLGFSEDVTRVTERRAEARRRAALFSFAATEVSRLLMKAGVAHVFFKGVVVDALYGGAGYRGTSDVDVLVDDVAAAERALASLVTGPAVELKRPRLRRTMRSVPASIHGMPVLIDLQCEWLSDPLVDDASAVIARAVSEKGALPRPSHDDYAAYVGGNLVLDRFSGRLKLALDLARIFHLSASRALVIDWGVVAARARRWRVSGALWVVAEFVERYLGVTAPAHLVDATAPRRWRRPLLRASMQGAPIAGAFTRALDGDSLVAGAAHFARYMPARLVDYLVDERC